jgi:hypothetical protein
MHKSLIIPIIILFVLIIILSLKQESFGNNVSSSSNICITAADDLTAQNVKFLIPGICKDIPISTKSTCYNVTGSGIIFYVGDSYTTSSIQDGSIVDLDNSPPSRNYLDRWRSIAVQYDDKKKEINVAVCPKQDFYGGCDGLQKQFPNISCPDPNNMSCITPPPIR